MNLLRPNDFFLNEDSPATVEQADGLLSLKLRHDGDCGVTAVIVPPSDWTGTSVRVKLRMRSANTNGDHAAMIAYIFGWPSANDPNGPVSGVQNTATVQLFSVAPAIIVSGQMLLEVPEGYTPDQALVLMVAMHTGHSTAGIEPRIVAVEYEFV